MHHQAQQQQICQLTSIIDLTLLQTDANSHVLAKVLKFKDLLLSECVLIMLCIEHMLNQIHEMLSRLRLSMF